MSRISYAYSPISLWLLVFLMRMIVLSFKKSGQSVFQLAIQAKFEDLQRGLIRKK